MASSRIIDDDDANSALMKRPSADLRIGDTDIPSPSNFTSFLDAPSEHVLEAPSRSSTWSRQNLTSMSMMTHARLTTARNAAKMQNCFSAAGYFLQRAIVVFGLGTRACPGLVLNSDEGWQ